MRLRAFAPSDQDAARELVLDGLRERWGDAFDPSYNDDLSDIDASYAQQGGDVLVIEDDGRLAAIGVLVPRSSEQGQLVRISVASTDRGKGLGRAVVAALVAQAHRRGMTEVIIRADTPWESALGLYRACGFTEVGRDETDTHFLMRLTPAMLAHVAAVGAGEKGYIDPATGLFVMTSWFLASRSCCENICRHCPWGNAPS